MAQIAADRTFPNFLELLPKLRTSVINEMGAEDRVRFTQCSKLCNEETKTSKKYLHGVKIICSSVAITIKCSFGEQFWRRGFILSFEEEEESGKKLKTYQNLRFQKLWEEELDNSTDILQCGLKEFENKLKTFQNSIKELTIQELYRNEKPEMLKNIGCGIEKLKNLQGLEVIGEFDVPQILSKLPCPLKSLCLDSRNEEEPPKQAYEVQQYLNLWNSKLDIAQFSKITAKRLNMPIGKLTEKHVFSFIRAWQNGTIGKKIEFYQWNLCGSNFSIRKFLRLLRDPTSEREKSFREFEIKSFIKPGKSAKLIVNNMAVKFNV